MPISMEVVTCTFTSAERTVAGGVRHADDVTGGQTRAAGGQRHTAPQVGGGGEPVAELCPERLRGHLQQERYRATGVFG